VVRRALIRVLHRDAENRHPAERSLASAAGVPGPPYAGAATRTKATIATTALSPRPRR
jgi:hypothetical protein